MAASCVIYSWWQIASGLGRLYKSRLELPDEALQGPPGGGGQCLLMGSITSAMMCWRKSTSSLHSLESSGTPLFAEALPSGSCAAMPPHHIAPRLISVTRQVKPSPGWRISSVSPTHLEVWDSVAQGPDSETGHSSGFSCHPLPGSCAGIPGAHWTCPGSARCPAAGCWCYSSAGHYRPAP